jgi:hypothetical protein
MKEFLLLFPLGNKKDKGNTKQTIPSHAVHAIFRGFKGDILPSVSDVNMVRAECILQSTRDLDNVLLPLATECVNSTPGSNSRD